MNFKSDPTRLANAGDAGERSTGRGVMRRAISAAILLVAAFAAPAQESPRPRVQPQTAVVPPASDCSAIVISAPRTGAVSRSIAPAAIEPRLPAPAPRVDQRPVTVSVPDAPTLSAPEAFERLAREARNGTYEAFSAALDASRAATASASGTTRDRYRSALDVYDDVNRIFTYSVEQREGSFFNNDLFRGEYDRLVREYPGYREFIEPFALTISGTKLYPTNETRRYLADEATRRVEQGGPVRSKPIEPLPRTSSSKVPAQSRPSAETPTTTVPRSSSSNPEAVRKPPVQKPAVQKPAATEARGTVPSRTASATTTSATTSATNKTRSSPATSARRSVSSSTKTPSTSTQPAPVTSGSRRRSSSAPSPSATVKPRVVPPVDQTASESTVVDPIETTSSENTTTASTSPTTTGIDATPTDTSPVTETSSGVTTSTSSTRFEQNVDDLLKGETQRPRRRSSILLLTIAAVALIVFLLFYFGMRSGSSEDDEQPTGNVIKHDAVAPKKAPRGKAPKNETADDQSWVDPETKQWIDEVNKGKKKS